MEPEREVKRLLKRFYKEVPSSGPDAKKVKFSEVKDNVTHHCPLTSISTKMISTCAHEYDSGLFCKFILLSLKHNNDF